MGRRSSQGCEQWIQQTGPSIHPESAIRILCVPCVLCVQAFASINQSARMFAFSTSCVQRAISAAMNFDSSCGELPIGSAPSARS
jgi:hypothetical protein